MRVITIVDATNAEEALAAADRLLEPRVREMVDESLRLVVQPRVQAMTPKKSGRLSAGTRVYSGSHSAVLYQPGPYAALVNFGGPRRDVIVPRHTTKSGRPAALRVGGGIRARVTRVRMYPGTHHMEHAIIATEDLVETYITAAIMDVFADEGLAA